MGIPNYQTFPFPQTITLKGPKGRYDEAVSTDASTIYGGLLPGMLLQYSGVQSEGFDAENQVEVARHSVIGGGGERLVAIEDSLQGGLISTPYADGSVIRFIHVLSGTELYMLLAPGFAISATGQLMSNGDGALAPAGNSVIESYTGGPSAAITNTTTETPFAVVGTIPINDFVAGDIIKIQVSGSITGVTGTPTLNVKLKLGNTGDGYTQLVATGAVAVLANDVFVIECELTVQTVGASSGTFTGSGFWNVGTPGTATDKAFDVAPGTTFKPNHAQNIQVTATWSAASASNTVVLNQEDVVQTRNYGTTSIVGTSLDTIDNTAGMTAINVRVLMR